MHYNREMIEINEGTAIGFIKHGDKYFEYLAPFFTLDFPELNDKDFREFAEWADKKAPIIHTTELEYEFPIAYWDNGFLSYLEVPKALTPIFEALMKYGKSYNKELPDSQKVIPYLKLWLPKTT
jgi:hypothetical protein